MTNAPESRKTHICRIVGTNRAGERLDDIWIDVERIDVIKSKSQLPSDQFQGVQRKLKWCDDPDSDGYSPDGTPSRLMTIVKVCDPENGNVDDPDEWVPVRVIKGMRSKGSVDSMGQGFVDRFVIDNDEGENTARIVERRKITHYDTNIDDDAQAAFDADPGRTQYVVDGQFYVKDLNTKDEDQYVDHEIITFLKNKGNVLDAMGLGRQTKLLNEYLIDDSDPAKGEVIGVSGINPPYRLDPFQNIVNCQFEAEKAVLISLGNFAIDLSDTVTGLYTENGTELVDSFSSASSAASGLGVTVVAGTHVNKYDFVAFGKPRDGKRQSCFIAVRANGSIERGVMQNGELTWFSAGGLSISTGDGDLVISCNFAGGAFFISYMKYQEGEYRYAVSFDGQSFASVDAYPGIVAASTGTDAEAPSHVFAGAGTVAYDPDKKRWVSVGWFQRNYVDFTDFGGLLDTPTGVHGSDQNFMSSVSSDGLNWSPHFDTSEIGNFGDKGGVGQIGGPGSNPNNCVAFGNGRFVAACAIKEVAITGPFDLASPLSVAASAISFNGSSWSSPIALPGAEHGTDIFHSSTASGVIFCKRSGLGIGIDGFFLMGSIGNVQRGALYYSLTGITWQKVYGGSQIPWYMSLLNKQKDNSVVIRV